MADEVKLRLSTEADTSGIESYGREFQRMFGGVKGGLDSQKKANEAIIHQLEKQLKLSNDIKEKSRLTASLNDARQLQKVLASGGIAAPGQQAIKGRKTDCISICDDSLKKLADLISKGTTAREYQFGEREPGEPGDKSKPGDMEKAAGKIPGVEKAMQFLANPEVALASAVAAAVGMVIVSVTKDLFKGVEQNIKHSEQIADLSSQMDVPLEQTEEFGKQLKDLGKSLGFTRDESIEMFEQIQDAAGKALNLDDIQDAVDETQKLARATGLSGQQISGLTTTGIRSGMTAMERGPEEVANFKKAVTGSLLDPKVLASRKELNTALQKTIETQLGSFRGTQAETIVDTVTSMNRSTLSALRGEKGASLFETASRTVAQGGAAGEAGQALILESIKAQAAKRGVTFTPDELVFMREQGLEGSGKGAANLMRRLNKARQESGQGIQFPEEQIAKFEKFGGKEDFTVKELLEKHLLSMPGMTGVRAARTLGAIEGVSAPEAAGLSTVGREKGPRATALDVETRKTLNMHREGNEHRETENKRLREGEDATRGAVQATIEYNKAVSDVTTSLHSLRDFIDENVIVRGPQEGSRGIEFKNGKARSVIETGAAVPSDTTRFIDRPGLSKSGQVTVKQIIEGKIEFNPKEPIVVDLKDFAPPTTSDHNISGSSH